MPSGCEDFNILNILLILISGTLSHSFDKQLPVDKFIIYNKTGYICNVGMNIHPIQTTANIFIVKFVI